MLELLLMRHAKSSWKTDAPSDHDRPLSRRGQRAVEPVARALAERALVPQLVICSDARRARQTMLLALQTWETSQASLPDIWMRAALYATTPALMLDALASAPQGVGRVMLIGHNPELEALLTLLTGQSATLTTGNVARLSCLRGSWAQGAHEPGEWVLHEILRPRELA